jgi:predicted RNA binding protein YcfA (HicA-like mRNA interferase family)
VKPVDTRRIRKILEANGCKLVGTEGSHEKWETPGGLSVTIVAGEKQQSPGLFAQGAGGLRFGAGREMA